MKPNLFSAALEVKRIRYVHKGLRDIADSTVFPVLPINLQQKVAKKLGEYILLERERIDRWPGDRAILDQFVAFLEERNPSADTEDEDTTFVLKTSKVIKQYVIEEYLNEDDDITFDTPLISGGIVDSFSMVSLKRFLENKYKISIPDGDASPEAFDSVNKITELVKRFIQ